MTFYKYTPALLDPETLDRTLIGREQELGDLARILRNASKKSISHPILIGAKGIGKTHILRILYHAVRGEIKTKGLDVYKDKFVPVIFSEEEYPGNFTKFAQLILGYLREIKPAGVTLPAAELNKESAVYFLKTFKEKTGKILLLLVDNVDGIIEGFAEEEHSLLRDILMTSDSVLLVGAAPTLFDSIVDHDKPFYNFFEIIWLNDLTFEETETLLKKYAEIDNKGGVIEELKRSEPKLRAIYELTGGNPRLILGLYHIMAEGDITSVEDTFLKLLDELTAFFRERIRDLSKQQREIVDVIARAEGLLTPTEISKKCDLPVNVVNSQLKRLEKMGYVKKLPKKGEKRVLYAIKEKCFSLWRQMRVEAGRRRLGFLVKFLQIWFTKEELHARLDETFDEIHKKLLSGYLEIQPELSKLWYVTSAIGLIRHPAYVAYKGKRYDVALSLIKEELRKNPVDPWFLEGLGTVSLESGRYKEAIEAFKKVIEIKSDKYEALDNLGVAYAKLNRHDEAIGAFKKAIEIKSDKHEAWNNLGATYVDLNRYDEAIEVLKKAIEIKSDMYEAWYNLGNAYRSFYRHDEAIEALKKAIEIKPDMYEAWYNLGNAYGSLFVKQGTEGNAGLAINNLRKLLNISPKVQEEDFYGIFISLFKSLIARKKVDIIKLAMSEIEKSNQRELFDFLSPVSIFVKYMDTGDYEIIERLRQDERIIVEGMIKIFEGKIKGGEEKKAIK